MSYYEYDTTSMIVNLLLLSITYGRNYTSKIYT
jgi:hypothetical protein